MTFLSESLYSFFVILFLELVLGADNIVFISAIVDKVKRPRLVAFIGLSVALIIRALMLFCLDFFIRSSDNSVIYNFSIFDIIILLGGFFLVYKSIIELSKVHNNADTKIKKKKYTKTLYALCQIIWIDFVLSFDSIVTAIAFTKDFKIIILAFAVTMLFMVTVYSFLSYFLSKYSFIRIMVFLFIGVLGVKLSLESFNYKLDHIYFYSVYIILTLTYFIFIKYINKYFFTF